MAEGPSVIIQENQRHPGCVLTLLYFILIGWWASFIWISLAWVLIILIITLPLGLMMVNVVPLISTLRQPSVRYQTSIDGTITLIRASALPQRAFLLRAVYFLLIGWWLSAI